LGIGEDYDMTRGLTLEFTRLPDRVRRWRQWKIHQDAEVMVSTFWDPDLKRPVVIDGEVLVEGRLAGITYNFWDQWFNVIRCYDRDLVFKGYYTDIITPVQKTWTLVEATDLFLDFFMHPDGSWSVQDEDEFQQALREGLMDEGVAQRARDTLDDIIGRAEAGEWPPDCVRRIPRDPERELRQVKRLALMGE
jgi:predicted RNA-binding protein associated with RNAse of E/G family